MKKRMALVLSVLSVCVALGAACAILFSSYSCMFYTSDEVIRDYIAEKQSVPTESIEVLRVQNGDNGNIYALFRRRANPDTDVSVRDIGLAEIRKVTFVPKLYKGSFVSYRTGGCVSSFDYATSETSSTVIFGDNTLFDMLENRASKYTVAYGDKTVSGKINGDCFIIPFETDEADGNILDVEVSDANGKVLFSK